jgi:hypothetical protein
MGSIRITLELMKERIMKEVPQSTVGLKMFSVANRFPCQLFTHFTTVTTACKETV